jgi:UDP-glucose 6-dehydrogenase
MPEFLTEKNYIQDFINCTHWVLGAGKDELNSEFVRQYEELINNAHRAGKIKHNTVIPMLNREAELVK